MVEPRVRLTTVELNTDDSALFLQFRKHQNAFKEMLEGGVFGLRKGVAEISMNNEGVVTGIQLTMKTK